MKERKKSNPFTNVRLQKSSFCGEKSWSFFEKSDNQQIPPEIAYFSKQPYTVNEFKNPKHVPSQPEEQPMIEKILSKAWLLLQIISFYIPIFQFLIPARVPPNPNLSDDENDVAKCENLPNKISLFEWHPTKAKFCYCFNLSGTTKRLVRVVCFKAPQNAGNGEYLEKKQGFLAGSINSDFGFVAEDGIHALILKTLKIGKKEIDSLAVVENETISLWDISSSSSAPKILVSIPLPLSFCNGMVSAAKFSNSKEKNILALSSFADHRVMIFEFFDKNQRIKAPYVETEKLTIRRSFLGNYNFDGPITSLTFSSDGKKLLVSNAGGSKMRIWTNLGLEEGKNASAPTSTTTALMDAPNPFIDFFRDLFSLVLRRNTDSALMKTLPNGEKIFVSKNSPNPNTILWTSDSSTIIYSRFNEAALNFLPVSVSKNFYIPFSIDLCEFEARKSQDVLGLSSSTSQNEMLPNQKFCGHVKSLALDSNNERLVINFQNPDAPMGVLELMMGTNVSKSVAVPVADEGFIFVGDYADGDDSIKERIAFWSEEPDSKTSLLATVIGRRVYFTPFYY